MFNPSKNFIVKNMCNFSMKFLNQGYWALICVNYSLTSHWCKRATSFQFLLRQICQLYDTWFREIITTSWNYISDYIYIFFSNLQPCNTEIKLLTVYFVNAATKVHTRFQLTIGSIVPVKQYLENAELSPHFHQHQLLAEYSETLDTEEEARFKCSFSVQSHDERRQRCRDYSISQSSTYVLFRL